MSCQLKPPRPRANWKARVGFISALLVLALVNCNIEAAGAEATDAMYSKPGQRVAAPAVELNLYCMGTGSPAVIFDSGFLDWAPAWSKVQPRIAEWTRACSHDRAGAGFSGPGPLPRSSVRIAGELHRALHQLKISGPYILVGAAFGGDNVRTFADLYLHEVAGMVLVDADATDLEPKSMQALDRAGRSGLVAQLHECGRAVAANEPLPVLDASQPQRTCAEDLFFRGLPEVAWSSELNAQVLKIARTNAAMYESFASEMEQMTGDEDYLWRHRRSLGSRPIRVLTSGNHGVPAHVPDRKVYEDEISKAQARWLSLSSNAKQIFAHSKSEYIQFDDTETVISAIREVYDQAIRPPVP